MSIYTRAIRSLLFQIPPETAHELGVEALKLGLTPTANMPDLAGTFGPIERFGLRFSNPTGLAAGFDKNAEIVGPLASLGFGFVEIGTVTHRPQPGNPKPRLFRLPKDNALINRLGFNNDGAAAVAERLKRLDRKCVVGVNIGKNKDVPIEEATENYLNSFDLLQPHADYVAINISSPNTPDLRQLQNAEHLDEMLLALTSRNIELGRKPLLVKIAPDLTEAEIEAVCDTCMRHGIDGLIATNTTISREGLVTANAAAMGAGGLSGRPLATVSTSVIKTAYRHTNGKLPIIGVGGIFDAADAFEKIAAGASLLQAYTGFIYSGYTFPVDVCTGLAAILREKGFASLDEAVGTGA